MYLLFCIFCPVIITINFIHIRTLSCLWGMGVLFVDRGIAKNLFLWGGEGYNVIEGGGGINL